MPEAFVGASNMSGNRQMSVAMQRLVDFISMVTNSTLQYLATTNRLSLMWEAPTLSKVCFHSSN
jgi:hypothetical protein